MAQDQELENRLKSAVWEFANSINSSGNVIADMSSLVEVTYQLPLSKLDYWERLISWEFSAAMKSHIQPKWKFWTRPPNLLTWIDVFSWDGYKREKVLRSISGGAPNSFFLALAFRRLNDWVPQVREAAREKIPQIAQSTNPTQVVEVIFHILSNWSSWGRMERSDRQVLLNIISSKNIADTLISELITSPSGPLTTIFAQMGRSSIIDNHLSEIAKKAIQPSVRAKAYKSLLEGKINWLEGRKWEWTDIRYCKGRLIPKHSERKLTLESPFLETLKKASVDRSLFVRRVAAEMLIRDLKNLDDEKFQLANHFASDKSQSVAELGRFALKKLS